MNLERCKGFVCVLIKKLVLAMYGGKVRRIRDIGGEA
jgi:hypothetical protein